ncbi:hypothetical protein BLNAU_23540 [Blattamonas nauphoetae]|uniref:Uncharacterized protein n=1 Tax=Blattamonas nauphoetae TaxID=2049346 RepID=A0ABQ9WPY8_9EUKA|nr:hypothetical protein BLNAU_23540 [Blattamonas nauphoetae]
MGSSYCRRFVSSEQIPARNIIDIGFVTNSVFYSAKQRMLHSQQRGRPGHPGRLTPEELDQLTNQIIKKLGR